MKVLVFAGALFAAAATTASAAAPDPAAKIYADALTSFCTPWLKGQATRGALAATAKAGGWDNVADAAFNRSGPWGFVTVQAAEQADGKRTCSAFLRTEVTPWSTADAETRATAWVTRTFPQAAKTVDHRALTIDAGPTVATRWVDSGTGLQITFATMAAKQSEPLSDVLLQVAPPS